jgi:ArsR family transcriptional regulator
METKIDLNIIKIFSEENRIKILHYLYCENICVCDLAKKLNMANSLISFHLKELFEAGILNKKREGNKFFYCIKDEWRERLAYYFKFLKIYT